MEKQVRGSGGYQDHADPPGAFGAVDDIHRCLIHAH